MTVDDGRGFSFLKRNVLDIEHTSWILAVFDNVTHIVSERLAVKTEFS